MPTGLDTVRPGTVVGPYRIMKGFRGHGGMAQIFLVEVREKYRQPNIPRRLALKVAKPEHQQALVAEADYLRLFNHPNVVRIFPLPGYHKPVYSAREEFPFGMGWYYAMEFLDGGALEETLTRSTLTWRRTDTQPEHPLNLHVVLGIVRQLLEGLSHIHARNIVNLDIKPANILFRRRPFRYWRSSVPEVVIGDFGIARNVRYPRVGLLGVATPEYVSPEHASEMRGHYYPVDIRSDIFSLGVVVYEMLTGQMPFANVALLSDPQYAPDPPSKLRRGLPAALDHVVLRALEKSPDRRFANAAEMRAALQQVRMPPDWPRARRFFTAAAVTGWLVASGVWVRDYGLDMLQDAIPPTATASAPTATPRSASGGDPTATRSAPPAEKSPATTVPAGEVKSTSTPMPSPTPRPTWTYTPPTVTPEG
ncbi:MAG: serine/threonine protein kinase [Anaerolineae bacterium]|nr:serine/threonine protein kinase [Anaerolineae bacterium]